MTRPAGFSIVTILATMLFTICVSAQHLVLVEQSQILTGAAQTELYLPLIKTKKIAVVANHSSLIGSRHLVDSLMKHGIIVKKIFTPEHGFRGDADAGASVASETDAATGLPVISLYGDKKAPSSADLEGIDIIVFDLQDVGVRFYTYISTLTYVMESCARHNIPLIVLDRPNPNGFYIDGPVLEAGFESFVGLHKVPVVYGLTIGEYAKMVNGEGWLNDNLKCNLEIVKLKGYRRNMLVKLNHPPSPNLKNWRAVYLYPSLCFFEGTAVSVGRGTDFPFEIYGHPMLQSGTYKFIPMATAGAGKPKLDGERCSGFKLSSKAESFDSNAAEIDLEPLISAYRELSGKTKFFNTYFEKLAGTERLQQQIEAGVGASVIRKSWQNDLDAYKKIRIKYLLYPDL